MSHFPYMYSKLLFFTMPWMLILFMFFSQQNLTMFIQWSIMKCNSTNICLPLILDSTGIMFSTTVLFISANVMMFSSEYMKNDMYLQRFSHLVMLFILSMNFLIYIPHLMCMLLGWDGLGITSFILVIYYQNPKSLAAGMITALMNRIGDVMILLSITIMLNIGHWNIMSMWQDKNFMYMMMMIMLAAMTKSAQIPFSSWLPAAMAAPTPVSALVHSSTLVTAGVFLLIRFFPALSTINKFCQTLLIIASITMLMAGSAAMFECDLKKIIALSTLSQLGIMMASLGLSLPSLAMFHLITHALFKALLFLCAGSLIHFHYHSQDLRSVGNIFKSNPLLLSCMLIANLALCGTPFMAGFYSKDLILETSSFDPTNSIILIMFFLATGLTTMYSTRLSLTIMWTASSSNPFLYTLDNLPRMIYPMILLATGAIMGGATISWVSFSLINEPFINSYLKLWPLCISIFSLILAWNLTASLSMFPTNLYLYSLNTSMWFLTPCMAQGIMYTPLKKSLLLLKIIDQGWIELKTSQGIFKLMNKTSNLILTPQSMMITINMSFMFIFMMFITIT
uniref:NADH-ubiquinone oxidoreductase chain 5 n=1 Tax=Laetmonice producta TaxID=2153329 RepID=A0A343W6E9_9ANNE|nr:NADH dehydrogenase subunit 5 [Laetmonice producta]